MKMNEPSITIPASAYKTFEPEVQRAIMAFFMSQFEAEGAAALLTTPPAGRDEKGLARLEIAEAKLFLNNCSEKTTTILQE
ncbi:MAG: hypothetical protein EOP18_10475, partial [Rhizobiaceae bacterium]